MNHDVFISYSRKDRDQVEALCKVLSAAGVKYWIDRSEIHASANFLTEITRNIKACKVLIFIASANSAASKFTQKEILYAIKHNKTILPYKIGDFQFDDNDELDFVFTNVQWVESLDEVVKSLEKQSLTHKAQTKPVEQPTPDPQPKPASEPQPQPQPTTKTYKVGDLYDDGTRKGVVFEVTPDGKHGKIVSLEEAELPWSREKVTTEVKYRTYGMVNMKAIQFCWRWREKYPAFAWCADLGEGWYLPARDELLELFKVKDVVNEEMERQNAKILEERPFWSSTEHDCLGSLYISMRSGNIFPGPKIWDYHVRAVAKF